MVAVITRIFGLQHIEIAEDIVGDTFLQAAETWKEEGIPSNPRAWLYLVAKQKTIQQFRRDKIFDERVLPEIQKNLVTTEVIEVDFSERNIKDSQLQMIFAICNPAIASEAQIGLALRILCGFNIDEIAQAFLTNKETINKRLFRAKEKLRTEGIRMEMPADAAINSRLDNVLHVIYLLFNEGYYSATKNQVVRKEFCMEALSLGFLLTEFTVTAQPKTNALVALMCFHASRLDARQMNNNHFILYQHQDENLWNRKLIIQGKIFLDLSAEGTEISSYHLEAGIAFLHCEKEDTAEKWDSILQLYNLLLQINYSPTVALNRTYALYKARGNEVAIAEANKLKLTTNHFYFVLLGELYTRVDKEIAKQHFLRAISLAQTATDKLTIKNMMDLL